MSGSSILVIVGARCDKNPVRSDERGKRFRGITPEAITPARGGACSGWVQGGQASREWGRSPAASVRERPAQANTGAATGLVKWMRGSLFLQLVHECADEARNAGICRCSARSAGQLVRRPPVTDPAIRQEPRSLFAEPNGLSPGTHVFSVQMVRRSAAAFQRPGGIGMRTYIAPRRKSLTRGRAISAEESGRRTWRRFRTNRSFERHRAACRPAALRRG